LKSIEKLIQSTFAKQNIQNVNTDNRLYIKLYKAIQQFIDDSEIPTGSFLPATRLLAGQLKVSRSTVLKAYELLVLESYIESKQGSGYLVVKQKEQNFQKTKQFDTTKYPSLSDLGKSFLDNISLINTIDDKAVAFRPGVPPLDIFPVNQWKNLSNLHWRHIKSSSLTYSAASGNLQLKKNIANYLTLTRGIKCQSEQVIIVSGSLQSLYLISSVLINPNDKVIMENPTFPNVYSIFKSLRASIEGVPVDKEGIIVSQITSDSVKLIHTTPSGHYPTSVRLSMRRRKELLKYAEKNNAYLIENDFEHEVSNYKKSMPSLFNIDQQGRTIFMGTFNRLLHPSLRIGYMVLPYPLIKPVEALLTHSHRFVAPSIQIVLNQFIEKKHLYDHIKNVIKAAEERKKIFIELFEEYFSDSMTLVNKNKNSLHLLAIFKKGAKRKNLLHEFAKKNILVHAYSKCFVGKEMIEGLIIGYSSVNEMKMKVKLKQLAGIYRDMKEY
jgi:GntR family transcriptional regulator/MocR family aminotransferase